jgi:hypothetical protein
MPRLTLDLEGLSFTGLKAVQNMNHVVLEGAGISYK